MKRKSVFVSHLGQRNIVLVHFPFSDQSGSKVRPALILSNNMFNKTSQDIIVCAMTSNLKPSKYTLIVGSNDFEKGPLNQKSAIKVETILKMNKAIIIKPIGTLKNFTFSKVIKLLSKLTRPSD